MNMVLVSLPQQSFNDALSCFEKIQKIDKNKDMFKFWKFCTWSIISSSICMESYLTQYIIDRCNQENIQNPFLNKNDRRANTFPKRIKFLKDVLKSEIPFYKSQDFKRIRDARQVRNDIIHFGKYNIFNEINEQNAVDSIDACRDLVSFILKGDKKDPAKDALWIFKNKSEDYDKNNSKTI